MISTGASNETKVSGVLAGSAKTTKDRLVDSSPTELVRPRVSQGMLISGKGEARTADPLPYGMARALGLNKSNRNGWHVVRRNGILYAQRDNHEINLTTTSWQSRNPHANLWLRFWFAADDSTLIDARQLLERSHPHRSPATGIYLVCAFVDPTDQKRIRNSPIAKVHDDPWSSAWTDPPGRVIGCIVISRLFHGNPNGRQEIATDANISLGSCTTRKEIVERLGVAWISRIAVDAPYRSHGIGCALADEARKTAAHRIPWQPKYLEIIRTVTDRQYKGIMGAQDGQRASPKDDFLTNAGYTRSPNATRSSPIRAFDSSGGRQATIESCWHLYYWCRLSEAPEREL